MNNFDLDFSKMYEWPRPAKIAVLLSIVILIFYLGYMLDISPYRGRINNDLQQLDEFNNQLQLMIDKQADIINDTKQLPALKEKLLAWQQNIITPAEMPAMLDKILKAGEDNQLKITAFEPGKDVMDGIYSKTPVSIELSGTYDQIGRFISEIANMPKLVVIDDYSLNRDMTASPSDNSNTSTLNSDAILSAELIVEIYRK